jgi:AcrR family transcriptional regulator
MATGAGLRALKKQRTRHDIVAATLELTLEDSHRATPIPLIAERAMVSPRTVSAYFPNKDEIAFDDSDELLADLEARLDEEDAPLVDRLRRWFAAAFLGVVLALRERVLREGPVDLKGERLEAGFTFLEAGLAALRAGAKGA